MKELDVELEVCKWAEKDGWLAPKLQWLNNTGWLDRCFIRKGIGKGRYIVAFIEFKKPGGRRSAKQKYWLGILRSMNVPAAFHDDALIAQLWLQNLYLESDDG